MFRRHLAHVSAATALILAATACAATPSSSGSTESADQDADATAPPTDSQQGAVDLSGIAELTDTSPSNPQERLVVSDPATGEQRAEILIPDHADPIPGRTMLSADFRHAVFEDDSGEIGVYRLDDDASPPAYVADYRITPPESSYSGGSVAYSRAQFSPDGETLWFEASTDKAGESILMSVPYASYEPGDEPHDSGLVVDALRDFGWTFDTAGAPVVTENDLSPRRVCLHTCSSTPIVVTPSKRCSSSIRTRLPSARTASLAVSQATPSPSAIRATVRCWTTRPSRAHRRPRRDSLARGSAAVLVSWRHTCPQPVHR